jgi:hypothetical protein
MHMGGGGGGGGGGGMGHHGGGGGGGYGHSSVQHHSSGASGSQPGHSGGISIGQILGLNHHGGGVGGFISNLLGHNHVAIHHHHMGGEPDQSPSWNMAMQAEKGVFARFLKLKFRATPALGFLLLFVGLIVWLGVVYQLRHHEPAENFNTLSKQLYGQQLPSLKYNQPLQAQDAMPAAMSPANPAPAGAPGATYAAPQQYNATAPTSAYSQFGQPASGQYAVNQSYPMAAAPMTGAYAGVPYGYTPQPRLRMVVTK